jgi:hypothetical protein
MSCAHVTRSLYSIRRCAAVSTSLRTLRKSRNFYSPSRVPFHVCLFSSALFRFSLLRNPLPAVFPRLQFGTDSLGTGASQPRLAIAFTCGVCSTRNHKMFSRRSYEHGVVIIRCDGEGFCAHSCPASVSPLTHFLALLQAAGRIT